MNRKEEILHKFRETKSPVFSFNQVMKAMDEYASLIKIGRLHKIKDNWVVVFETENKSTHYLSIDHINEDAYGETKLVELLNIALCDMEGVMVKFIPIVELVYPLHSDLREHAILIRNS